MRTEPAAVIVGTGRSGTGYIAAVLTAAGVPCGHEQWWNPFGDQTDGLLVDSSWCALALGLDDFDGIVLHQVRHPLSVISSLVHAPIDDGPYLALAHELIPARTDRLVWAMEMWWTATRIATDRAAWGWRVDDVDAALVEKIAAAVDRPLAAGAAELAVATIQTDLNQHTTHAPLTWSDLPAGSLREMIRRSAEQWGWQ